MKRIADKNSILDACDELEGLKPGKWNREDVITYVGGGSASTINPIIKIWRLSQTIRKLHPEDSTKLLHGIIEAVNDKVNETNETYEASLHSIQDELENIASEHQEVIAEFDLYRTETDSAISNRDQRIESFEVSQADLKEQLVVLKTERDAAIKRADDLGERVTLLEVEQRQERENFIQRHDANISKLESKSAEAMNTQATAYKTEIAKIKSSQQVKIDTLKEEMEDLQLEHIKKTEEVKAELDTYYKNQESYWIKEVSASRDEAKELRNEIAEIQRRSADQTVLQMKQFQEQLESIAKKQDQTARKVAKQELDKKENSSSTVIRPKNND